jgi:hypothetical protein
MSSSFRDSAMRIATWSSPSGRPPVSGMKLESTLWHSPTPTSIPDEFLRITRFENQDARGIPPQSTTPKGNVGGTRTPPSYEYSSIYKISHSNRSLIR